MILPRIAALDLSLTATGVAWTTTLAQTSITFPVGVATIRDGGLDGHRRLDNTLVRLASAGLAHAQLVVIEDIFVNPHHPATAIDLAGLHALVTQWLWNADVPYVYVGGKKRAKYATGNGNADKKTVLSAVRSTYGNHVAYVDNDNEADALALLAMALHHYGQPLSPVPPNCAAALAGVRWPTLRRPRPDVYVPDILTPGGAAAAIAGPVREQPEIMS